MYIIPINYTAVFNPDPNIPTSPIGDGDALITDVKVNSHLVAGIAFKNGVWEGREVVRNIGLMIQYVSGLIPRFEKFF